MATPIGQRIAGQATAAAGLRDRLVLVVGPPRSGKTSALREFASQESWPILNVNLSLSERLLELTSTQRKLHVPRLLDELAAEPDEDVLILDNTEVRFSVELERDPLRLLQDLARNRTVIASWAGTFADESLTYADPAHPEFRRYQKPDALVLTTMHAKGVAAHTGGRDPE